MITVVPARAGSHGNLFSGISMLSYSFDNFESYLNAASLKTKYNNGKPGDNGGGRGDGILVMKGHLQRRVRFIMAQVFQFDHWYLQTQYGRQLDFV